MTLVKVVTSGAKVMEVESTLGATLGDLEI